MTSQALDPLDEESFVRESFETIRSAILSSIEARGKCVIGLSGGKTPGPVYARLGADTSIDWSAVHVFLCDERYVSADHDESNQRMLRETLLKYAAIPAQQICVPATGLPLDACVSTYNHELQALLSEPADVVVLGIGGDGHTASLFPPLPQEAFGPDRAIHTETDAFAIRDRISVTMPVLTDARHRILLLRGRNKIETWQEMTVDGADERFWPLKAVAETGELDVIIGR